MIAIAVLLLLIVVGFTVAVMVGNPGLLTLSVFGAHVPVTAAGIYFNGAGAMLVLVLALSLLRRGVRRDLRRRKQVRELRSAANRKTRDQLSRSRGQVAPPSAPYPAAERPAAVEPAVGAHAAPPRDQGAQSAASTAERQALLDEAEELTGDSPDR